ncbi:hypothetical protein E2C01_033991 [Portunus trituberculatus]|uniref:Uncharacterized protein n=1 Tax=Portunus trituberculatus TaxID=210409 RepID=A0A5B7F5Q4_PORTR|nr:hypothetical protein [Portunus trituberculatus]
MPGSLFQSSKAHRSNTKQTQCSQCSPVPQTRVLTRLKKHKHAPLLDATMYRGSGGVLYSRTFLCSYLEAWYFRVKPSSPSVVVGVRACAGAGAKGRGRSVAMLSLVSKTKRTSKYSTFLLLPYFLSFPHSPSSLSVATTTTTTTISHTPPRHPVHSQLLLTQLSTSLDTPGAEFLAQLGIY